LLIPNQKGRIQKEKHALKFNRIWILSLASGRSSDLEFYFLYSSVIYVDGFGTHPDAHQTAFVEMNIYITIDKGFLHYMQIIIRRRGGRLGLVAALYSHNELAWITWLCKV
jgi:hypothetical protein